MPIPLPGFPDRFPIRDDGRRPWRYRIIAGFLHIVLRTLYAGRLTIEGVDDAPRVGPLLVVCNHISNWDPLLIGAFIPGELFAMAKLELFRPAFMAWVMAGCNCFPVNRGKADRQALRTSLALLGTGKRLLLFVEGTRSREAGMGAAEAGAGFLVRRSGARVLPVAIWGTERGLYRTGRLLPRRGEIHLRCGAPVVVHGSTDREIADDIAGRIAALLPEHYRGVHATPANPSEQAPGSAV